MSIFNRRLISAASTIFMAIGVIPVTHASVQYDFYLISNNVTYDVSSQLSVTVYEAGELLSPFDISMTSHDVLFVFSNNVGTASSITDIYFADDDDLLVEAGGSPQLWESSGVDYEIGATPPSLPGANDFVVSSSSDSEPPRAKNGIDESDEMLGISFDLEAGFSFGDLTESFDKGSLRIGAKVQALPNGESHSYIAPPPSVVPEATSVVIWSVLAGAVGIVAVSKQNNV